MRITQEFSSSSSSHLLSLFFLLLFLLQSSVSDRCGTYLLHNECTGLVGEQVALTSSSQEEQYQTIAFTVSDIRLFTSLSNSLECRRSYIWLLCNLAFPSCVEEDNMNNCTELPSRDTCDSINSTCATSLATVSVDCEALFNSFTNSPNSLSTNTSVCNSTIPFNSTIISSIFIPPVTCIDNTSSLIPCCPPPFLRSLATEECIPACPIPFFSVEKDQTLEQTAYTLTWISTGIFVVSFLPLCVIDNMLIFPRYVMPLAAFLGICYLQTLIWSLYAGGATPYVCGDYQNEQSYDLFDTLEDFVDSTRCKFQFAFGSFFSLALSYWIFILCICLFSLFFSEQYPFLKAFQLPSFNSLSFTDVSKVELRVHFGWVFPLALFLVAILTSEYADISLVLKPGENSCYYSAYWVYSTQLAFFCVTVVLMIVTLYQMVRRSCHLLLIQWRSVSFVWVILNCFTFDPFPLYASSKSLLDFYNATFQTYYLCVIESANVYPFPCSQPDGTSIFWFYTYFGELVIQITTYSWMGVSCFVTYLTNPFILRWWYYLLFEQRIVRDPKLLLDHIQLDSLEE